MLLAIGVAAIGLAADLILRRPPRTFLLAVLFATAALANEADIFSFVMTESAIFAIYSAFAWAFMRALMRPGVIWFAVAGATLGLLSLTKPSFAVLLPAALAIVFAFGYWITKISRN